MDNESRFSVKVTRSITEIDRHDWERLYPPIPESYGFLKTVEEALGRQFKFYYVAIYDGPALACVAPCFAVDYPLETTLEGPLKDFIARLRKVLPGLFVARAVVCGSPACEGRIGIKDMASGQTLVRVLARGLRSIAAREKASFIAFKDFSEEYSRLLRPLEDMKFHRVAGLPSVALDLPFKSYGEYLSSLSATTRKDLRRKFKKVDGSVKIEMETRNELGELLDDVYDLYQRTFKKSDMKFEEITKDFFKNISKNMPDETRFFLWRLNGKLVGFTLCLISKDLLVAEYLGFDYDVALDYHLYFLAYRDKIDWCIRNGIRRYESGALNYDPKKRLDFKFVPQYVYAKHTNRIANFFLGPLCALLKPENFDPILKSSKEKALSF